MNGNILYDKWEYIQKRIKDEHSLTDVAFEAFILPLNVAIGDVFFW